MFIYQYRDLWDQDDFVVFLVMEDLSKDDQITQLGKEYGHIICSTPEEAKLLFQMAVWNDKYPPSAVLVRYDWWMGYEGNLTHNHEELPENLQEIDDGWEDAEELTDEDITQVMTVH